MCRFLIVKWNNPTNPQSLLVKFAHMAKESNAPDGDSQGDGWGVAWLNEKNEWKVKKSLSPIWEEISEMNKIPETQICVAHARSASFPNHKGVVAFNQPYTTSEYAFVFNGLLRGVSLADVPGRIGAEKIWWILQQELQKRNPEEALERTKQLLIKNTKEIIALNIGLATKETIHSLNYFTQHRDYYTLHTWSDASGHFICSASLTM